MSHDKYNNANMQSDVIGTTFVRDSFIHFFSSSSFHQSLSCMKERRREMGWSFWSQYDTSSTERYAELSSDVLWWPILTKTNTTTHIIFRLWAPQSKDGLERTRKRTRRETFMISSKNMKDFGRQAGFDIDMRLRVGGNITKFYKSKIWKACFQNPKIAKVFQRALFIVKAGSHPRVIRHRNGLI